MNKEQLAERLDVTERTVERYMNDGLPYYKYGRRVRFKWSEVEKHFIATCHVVKAPVTPLKKRAVPPPPPKSPKNSSSQ
jgi:excisionase family DNA binding protein